MIVNFLQDLGLPALPDIARYVGGYGIGVWIAVQTYLNGKSLSRIRGTLEGENGIVARIIRAEEQISVMPTRLTEMRDSAVDRVQELVSGMETRLVERLDRVEERRKR